MCSLAGQKLPNCEHPIEGTIAVLSCEPLYQEAGLTQNPLRKCRDGSWDYPINQCYPGQHQNEKPVINVYITFNLYPPVVYPSY